MHPAIRRAACALVMGISTLSLTAIPAGGAAAAGLPRAVAGAIDLTSTQASTAAAPTGSLLDLLKDLLGGQAEPVTYPGGEITVPPRY
ncbi:MAG: hypothetical protein ACRDRL_31265 [Sciscionella sp.]